MNGVLLVDKPKGWSSFDVIRHFRSQFKKAGIQPPKIGHAGTLDPMATGLLIVLIGKATKQADKFLKLDKAYEAEVTLGAVSDTDDAEGKIVESSKPKAIKPTQKQIKEALQKFTGQITQVPPQHSAIKVAGKRAYAMARKGQKVDLKPRLVTIYELRIKSYKYPKLELECRVSSGTYIRALARDIGETLEIGAYLSCLRRTQIGKYTISNSVQLDGLDLDALEKNIINTRVE